MPPCAKNLAQPSPWASQCRWDSCPRTRGAALAAEAGLEDDAGNPIRAASGFNAGQAAAKLAALQQLQAPHPQIGGLLDGPAPVAQPPLPPVAPVPAAQPINFYDALQAYQSSYGPEYIALAGGGIKGWTRQTNAINNITGIDPGYRVDSNAKVKDGWR